MVFAAGEPSRLAQPTSMLPTTTAVAAFMNKRKIISARPDDDPWDLRFFTGFRYFVRGVPKIVRHLIKILAITRCALGWRQVCHWQVARR